jgi:cytochrome P450
MEAWLREWSRSVMLEAAERGDCDFVHDVAGQLPMQTINQLMAIPDEDRTKLADWADRVIAGGGGRDRDQPDDPGAELGAYGYRLAEQRRGQGNDDLISLMLEGTYRGEPLDAVGFAGLFVQIAVAGNETTRSMLAGTLLAFEQFPETYRRLSEAGNVPPSAVEEMLRWTTPVHYFRRTATTDTEVRGQRIAEGDKVLLHYTAANHDPEVFVDPGTFDIDRDPNPHLSFGWGEHFCLGARLARLEATVFWEEFFRVFKGFERTGEAVRLPSNLTNTITSIPVRLLPR